MDLLRMGSIAVEPIDRVGLLTHLELDGYGKMDLVRENGDEAY
jgi:hypothetical protein